MLGSALQPEFRELLAKRQFATIKDSLRELEVPDIAELLAELNDEEQALVFRLLGRDQAAEVFSYLPLDAQEALIARLSQGSITQILNEMDADDRTGLLEELPGTLAQRLLKTLRGDNLAIAQALLAYPADSVGRRMTPQYVAIGADWTVGAVMEHIRSVAPTKETVHHLYVVDASGHLLDHLSLEEIVVARPETLVSDLMTGPTEEPALKAQEDQETAVELFKKYDMHALPVVDSRNILVGILTADDVLDLQEEEDTEDFQMMAGVAALEDPYFQTTFLPMIRKRAPALVALFIAEIFTVMALTRFETNLGAEIAALLVIFVPLINASAGNAGSQMAGLVIRGLAVREMDLTNWWQVGLRELRMGLTLGMLLAALAWVVGMLFGKPAHISAALSLAMLSAVTLANITGAMMPFLLKRIGLDPAVTSAPLIASMMDMISVLLFLTIAITMIGAFG